MMLDVLDVKNRLLEEERKCQLEFDEEIRQRQAEAAQREEQTSQIYITLYTHIIVNNIDGHFILMAIL